MTEVQTYTWNRRRWSFVLWWFVATVPLVWFAWSVLEESVLSGAILFTSVILFLCWILRVAFCKSDQDWDEEELLA